MNAAVMRKHHHSFLSVKERLARGKALRSQVPRSAHAGWRPADDRPDALALLEASDRGRLPQLLPIRYGRMIESPFAFLRGAAAIMAYDLARTPVSGTRVQACGDCHLLNFGIFATPDRAVLFDVNDFDETLPAPWEWDLKHLAVSAIVAGRQIRMSNRRARAAARGCVRAYREHMREYARMSALEVWYARLDLDRVVRLAADKAARKAWRKEAVQARPRPDEYPLTKLTEIVDGRLRLRERKPLLYHPSRSAGFERNFPTFFALYRDSLPDDRRVLLDRYHLADVAMKVVGVGSVGTRCAVALLEEEEGKQPLFLQFKEARPSVLAPYAGRSVYANQGQRVVAGQRLLQATSDILLGWSRVETKRHQFDFYFRQLHERSQALDLEDMSAAEFADYAALCGWALARAHARSGDAACIAGYAGKGDALDRAVAAFALAYADQVERDHARLLAAVRSGRIAVADRET